MPAADNCIFCKIINKKENAEIYFEDNEVIVFKDIKPASKIHVLAVPKQHIINVKELKAHHKPLVEKLINVGKRVISENHGDVDDSLLGFHLPPFNSVSHLHLHVISPKKDMSYISKIMFKENPYWFTTADKILNKLDSHL